MSNSTLLMRRLRHYLFDSLGQKAYAVLDGCQIPQLPSWLENNQIPCVCLFDSPLDPMLEAAAPQLVELTPDSPLLPALFTENWGKPWGIFLLVPEQFELAQLRRYLRSILMVRQPGGRSMLFRFYDPRSFKCVWANLNDEQRGALFGLVSAWLIEGDSPEQIIRFEPNTGRQGELLPLEP
ncbi:DUF4123 domain-containing protein [Azotobacter chroococcum]|uniref:DUF4123 domain-containing protein n=1 Tax=Azotobacter chroococcum TaxID=353 RepID=UPI0010ADE7D0|nr:DUF4123 domain-containing protein [Azotobacter chroococcum]TKD46937.1 DUF4123 domain-containing protein [Azotobacter chroococcum]